MSDDRQSLSRRQYLAATGLLATGLAGCASEDEPSDTSSGGSGDGGDSSGDETGGDSGGEATEEATPEPTEEPTEEATEESQKKLEILEDERFDDDYSSGVRGIVQNNADETLSYVAVEAQFYDSDDVKLEDGLDNTQDLKSGGKWQFECMFLGDSDQEWDHYEISVSDSAF